MLYLASNHCMRGRVSGFSKKRMTQSMWNVDGLINPNRQLLYSLSSSHCETCYMEQDKPPKWFIKQLHLCSLALSCEVCLAIHFMARFAEQ